MTTNKYLEKIASQWIQKATSNRGGLHRSLGIPEGQTIPKSKIEAAASLPGKTGKEARLAETLEGMKKRASVKEFLQHNKGNIAAGAIKGGAVGISTSAKLREKLKGKQPSKATLAYDTKNI